jgi:hypothetical protein
MPGSSLDLGVEKSGFRKSRVIDFRATKNQKKKGTQK